MERFLSFYHIVKTGSFSRASENVFRTQSAISHQIKNLETELNIRLFERYGKVIKLTWEGEILFDMISKFLNDLDNLKRIFEDSKHGKRGKLVIATTSGIMAYFLPNIVKKFINKSARIKFKFITSNFTSEIMSMVLDGVADLGIGVKLDLVCPKKINFLSWKFYDKMLLTRKGHPLSQKRNITLSDISHYPLILYRDGTITRADVEEAFVRNGLPFEIIMEMDVSENIKKYVEMGVGISVLSLLTLTNEDKKKFFLFNVNHLFKKIEYGIYYRKNKYITTSMKNFINFFAPGLLDTVKDFSTQRNGLENLKPSGIPLP